jgi:O-acetyl-ADP-ribose deacetylase (regulator of RNase III)
MDDELEIELDMVEIERAVLNETEEGRIVAAEFVDLFGDFVSHRVRPRLRTIAADGGEPQLLVNGLAELMRRVADSIEFPIGSPR